MDFPILPTGLSCSTASSTSPSLTPVSLSQTPTPSIVPPSTASGLPPIPPSASGLPPIPPSSSSKTKGSKKAKTSFVWEHFEEYEVWVDDDKNLNEDGTKMKVLRKKAKCKYCTSHYFADSGINDTSNMGKHQAVCTKMPGKEQDRRLEYFKTCVAKEKIECKGIVVLDVPTRWNSTYLMLSAALKFETTFTRMAEDDENNANYLAWFGENEEEPHEEAEAHEDEGAPKKSKKRVGPPKSCDWSSASTFVTFLKVFYDMTLKMSLTLHPSVHETFHDLISIEEEIRALCWSEDDMWLDEVNDNDSDEAKARKVLKDMSEAMRVKFVKYWGDLDKMNQLLMVALVLDPRYKLKNLTHVLENFFYLDKVLAAKKTNDIKIILVKLYEKYAIPTSDNIDSSACNVTEATSSSSLTTKSREPKGGRKRQEMTRSWMEEAAASNVVVLEHEVDRYIMDPIEAINPDIDFDILSWWKHNGVKYPGLATIAKDILAIPVSTVASEACFSTGGRVVNSFRASLTPKMVEALICCQNWLRSGDISSLQFAPTIEEIEFYEELESEYASTACSKKTAPATFC